MKTAKPTIKRLIFEEKSLEVVEYAIIAGLIVLAALITITAVGAWVRVRYDSVKGELGA